MDEDVICVQTGPVNRGFGEGITHGTWLTCPRYCHRVEPDWTTAATRHRALVHPWRAQRSSRTWNRSPTMAYRHFVDLPPDHTDRRALSPTLDSVSEIRCRRMGWVVHVRSLPSPSELDLVPIALHCWPSPRLSSTAMNRHSLRGISSMGLGMSAGVISCLSRDLEYSSRGLPWQHGD